MRLPMSSWRVSILCCLLLLQLVQGKNNQHKQSNNNKNQNDAAAANTNQNDANAEGDPKGTWLGDDPDSGSNATNLENNNQADTETTAINVTGSEAAGDGAPPPELSTASSSEANNETASSVAPAETAGTISPSGPAEEAPTPAPDEGEIPGDGEGPGDGGGEGEGEMPGEEVQGDNNGSEETPMPTGDDNFEGGDDEFEEPEGEGGDEWGVPEVEGTPAPYVPPTGDDPFAKKPDESEWTGDTWTQETPEQMMHDKNVIIAVSSVAAVAFVLAICTAQQVIENPDGCCASLCRCNVGFFCFFCKIICFPCRMCCGNKDRRTHDLMIGDSNSYTHDLELT